MKKTSQSMIAVIALLAALSLMFAACAGGNHAADKEPTTPTQTAEITEKNNDEAKDEGSTAETTVNNGNIQESPNNGTGNSSKPSTSNPTPTTPAPNPTPTSPSNPPVNNQPQNPSTPSNPPVNNEHQHNYVTTTETVHHDAVYNEVKHEAEYKDVWVVDKEAKPDTIIQIPIYGERQVFSVTDLRTDETFNFYTQDAAYWAKCEEIGAGNYITGYCIEEYVIGYEDFNCHDGTPEQGHWENQLVKAAWTEKVLVKAAWDETITKSVCSICGKQK